MIVAQGTEAGGHVRGTTGILPLLSQVVPSVDLPVIAAGGIARGRDLAVGLGAGAAGGRVGTRFVASSESGAHRRYVEALLGASDDDTCLTEAFSAGWPDAPHRVLRSAVAAAQSTTENVVGETRLDDRVVPVQRFSPICPSNRTTGAIEAMALYAGESVGDVNEVLPAAEIVAQLLSEAEATMAATR
jgi:NAD(P)H-dependent flavin oxidoreductase YrpB (nitropropane dioxygenase family)